MSLPREVMVLSVVTNWVGGKSFGVTAREIKMMPTTKRMGRMISVAHEHGMRDFCSSCRRRVAEYCVKNPTASGVPSYTWWCFDWWGAWSTSECAEVTWGRCVVLLL